jgi:Fanconi anemia group M protein
LLSFAKKDAAAEPALRNMEAENEKSLAKKGNPLLDCVTPEITPEPEQMDFSPLEENQPSIHETRSGEITLNVVPGKVSILVDHRETASPVAKTLSQLGATISFAALPTGDYVVSQEVGIERKSSSDFAASIIDGRLFRECMELAERFKSPILILEGSPFGTSAIHPNAIRAAIATLIAKIRVSVLQTADAPETAAIVYMIAKKVQEDRQKPVRIRAEKNPTDEDRVQEFVLAGVPGLNNYRSKSLLAHFGNLERVFTASEDELKEAEGIGPKLARQVRNAATHSYGTQKQLKKKPST